MTDPKENEQVDEELSTDELKSVSGGVNLINIRNNPSFNPSQNNRNSLNLSSVSEDSNNNYDFQIGQSDWRVPSQASPQLEDL